MSKNYEQRVALTKSADNKVIAYCESIMARTQNGEWYAAERAAGDLYRWLRDENRKKRS